MINYDQPGLVRHLQFSIEMALFHMPPWFRQQKTPAPFQTPREFTEKGFCGQHFMDNGKGKGEIHGTGQVLSTIESG